MLVEKLVTNRPPDRHESDGMIILKFILKKYYENLKGSDDFGG
jgi:hypothetical protein